MAEMGTVLFRLPCRGEGVVGLAQGLVLELGLVLGLGLDFSVICLGRRGEGDEDEMALEKKEVIWLC